MTRWLPWIALAVIFAIATWVIMRAGRGTTFFYDDWPYVLERANWDTYTLLRPHNEHLQVFPLLLYKILFETVGLHEHWVYRLALVVLNLLTGLLLFLYARRRITDWPAVGLAACLILMSASWYNIVYSFQVNFVGAMAAGMGALLALDREDRKGDILAALLLGVCIGSSSVGFPFLLGAVVEIVWRRDWRRWWVVGVPIIAYLAWTLKYGTGSSTRLHNTSAIPGFILDGADDATGAILGLGLDVGLLAFWALVALTVREVLDGRVTARLVAAISMPLGFWALTALGRADQGIEADANRYLYAAGLFVALVALEVARRYPIRGRAAAILAGFLLFGAVANGHGVAGGGAILRGWSEGGKAAVTAIVIAGPENVEPTYNEADPTQGFIVAGPLFAAVDRYDSSPGFTIEELREESPGMQRLVDDKMAQVLRLNVEPVERDVPTGTESPRAEGRPAGRVVAAGAGCVRVEPSEPEVPFALVAPRGGVIVRAAEGEEVVVRLRRFSSLFSEQPIATIAPGDTGRIAIPVDRESTPWRVETKTSGPAEICSLG